ncbi:hypothetical protein [Oceanobacillus halophilus]|uniref:DUF3679 domain-containing protein n=1 Tax=Oceanobacillus halophilus TaxID=930130 RepID=A0A495ACZ5_9BACI|nr:hypothetical protein [Oceanobacillus halophilus]RKQ37839.1 hypothetical protein D8M06_03310 [Oceanobacillus halophilus]
MGRTFIILLLLAVFFLSGTLYGMNQSSEVEEIDFAKENKVVNVDESSVPEDSEVIISQTATDDVMNMEENIHLTNNAASFLETSVQGFFEIVVGVLYQIAEIFF